jgi:NTP pyrophosphatase (non-canonical NTP hydrolase)
MTYPAQNDSANYIKDAANLLVAKCHGASKAAGWWNAKDGTALQDNPLIFSNKLMLTVSELAEAMEGDRKNLMDDKLPHRTMREVELADAVIRICDLAGAFGMDLGGAIEEKMAFNAIRPDHKIENRVLEGGKSY